MLLISISLLVVLVSFLFLKDRREKAKHKILEKYPTPAGVLPVLGHAYLMPVNDGPRIRALFATWRDQFPKTFMFWMSWEPHIMVCHPESVEVVLKSTRNITKSTSYDFLLPWLKTGLLTSTGEKWRERRHILTPTFHFNVLSGYFPIFHEQADIMIHKLNENTGKAIDIYPFISHCALDIICKAAMGVTVDAQTNQDSEYVHAVNAATKLMWNRAMTPWLWPDFTYYVSPSGYQWRKALSILHQFSQSVIKSRRGSSSSIQRETNPGEKRYLAFLDLLLEAKDEKGIPFSDTDIQEEVDTFMFEGHDTTAAGMVWTIFLLAKHQEVQKKVQQELDQVLGSSTSPTINQLSELKYLECSLKEAMRLHPSVPNFARKIEEDMDICGYIAPKGIQLTVSTWLLHRHPDVWENPISFIPERWDDKDKLPKSPFAYIPFSAGSRNCIGQKFAMMEEKVLLAMIFKQFDIEVLDEPEGMADVILRPVNGVKVKLTPRIK